jgi:hypothetical protein
MQFYWYIGYLCWFLCSRWWPEMLRNRALTSRTHIWNNIIYYLRNLLLQIWELNVRITIAYAILAKDPTLAKTHKNLKSKLNLYHSRQSVVHSIWFQAFNFGLVTDFCIFNCLYAVAGIMMLNIWTEQITKALNVCFFIPSIQPPSISASVYKTIIRT